MDKFTIFYDAEREEGTKFYKLKLIYNLFNTRRPTPGPPDESVPGEWRKPTSPFGNNPWRRGDAGPTRKWPSSTRSILGLCVLVTAVNIAIVKLL